MIFECFSNVLEEPHNRNEVACDTLLRIHANAGCPDRPGHGLSSFQQDRKLGDYPKDISQLAKHLGTAKYHVFGQSGGGPYAVACAYGSPKDEILNVAVIAGIGPPAVLTVRNAGLYTVAVLSAQRWIPSMVRYLMNWYLEDDRRLQKNLNRMYDYLTEEDRAEVSTLGAEPLIMASLKAAYAQGADGVIRDGQIYKYTMGFSARRCAEGGQAILRAQA
jgi:pimeloyl-ACP methyl ester carboxylesterase